MQTIREEDNSNSKLIKKIKKGTEINIIGQSNHANCVWYLTDEGWIAGTYVHITDPDWHIYPNYTLSMIQSVFDSGNKIIIHAGKYRFSQPVTIKSGTFISIEEGTELIQDGFLPIFTGDVKESTRNYNGASGITIRGGKFVVPQYESLRRTSIINFFHSKKITMEDFQIVNSGNKYGISFIGCSNVRLENYEILGAVGSEKINTGSAVWENYPYFPVRKTCYDGTVTEKIIM